MRIDPGEIWRWINGHGAGRFWALVLVAEELFRFIVTRVRKKHEAEVLKALQMGGSSPGWGMSEEQIAGQCGWEPRKARSALRRLAKAGRVREKDGRWYLNVGVARQVTG
jgi:hypothetical protein